jgi:hypothetical protein
MPRRRLRLYRMKRARRAKRRLGGRGENGKGHTVIKYSPQGKVLLTLGQPGQAGNAPGMFDMPSDVITAANGDIFVADGHGGRRQFLQLIMIRHVQSD